MANVAGNGLTYAPFLMAEVLALIAWVQQRNHTAYLSHRKRRATES